MSSEYEIKIGEELIRGSREEVLEKIPFLLNFSTEDIYLKNPLYYLKSEITGWHKINGVQYQIRILIDETRIKSKKWSRVRIVASSKVVIIVGTVVIEESIRPLITSLIEEFERSTFASVVTTTTLTTTKSTSSETISQVVSGTVVDPIASATSGTTTTVATTMSSTPVIATTVTTTTVSAGTIALSSKTVIASILAGILVIGGGITGTYISEPEAFADPITTLNDSIKHNIISNDSGSLSNSKTGLSSSDKSSGSLGDSDGTVGSTGNSGSDSSPGVGNTGDPNGSSDVDAFSDNNNATPGGNGNGGISNNIADVNTLRKIIETPVELETKFQLALQLDSPPIAMAFDEVNNILYVLDDSDKIYKFDDKYNNVGEINLRDHVSSRSPKDISINSNGNIYLAIGGASSHILILDSDGNFQNKIMNMESHSTIDLTSIAIDSNDNIYVTDQRNQQSGSIIMFDSNGKFKERFGALESGRFTTLTIDHNDNIYAAAGAILTHSIYKFDSQREISMQFGEHGVEAGQLHTVTDILVDKNNFIFLTDNGHGNVQKFSSDGEFIEVLGVARNDNNRTASPGAMATNSEGVYVIDRDNHRVIKFDFNGKTVKTFAQYDDILSISGVNTGIASDIEGNIYVHNRSPSEIQTFDSDGNLLDNFGIGSQSYSPMQSLAIDSRGDIYVLTNKGIQKISHDRTKISLFYSHGEYDHVPNDGFISAIAIDSKDNVYTVNQYYLVKIFNSNGDPLNEFYPSSSSRTYGTIYQGSFSNYFNNGIYIDDKDIIYLTNTNNRSILKINTIGEVLDIFQINLDNSNSLDVFPEYSITGDKNNNIYVSNAEYDQIIKFNSNGNSIDTFGSNHKNVFEIFYPTSIVSVNDKILFSDKTGNKIVEIDFEDAIATFSAKFDEIVCNTDSMINDPVEVPPEVTAALPIFELLSRANNLTFETQHYKEGLLFYYITSQIQPTNIHAWNGIGYTQTQICSNNSAETAYIQALSIDRNNTNAKIGLADFTTNQVNRGDESILKLEDVELQLQSVFELDSRNTNALNALGYIEILRENYDKAIDYYQDSLKIDHNKVTTLNGLALAHLRSDNLGESTSTYLQVINIDPNNFDAITGLITTYTQQGFPELSEPFIDKLDESNSAIADKLTEQGNWLQQNGQEGEAQRLFDAAEKL